MRFVGLILATSGLVLFLFTLARGPRNTRLFFKTGLALALISVVVNLLVILGVL